MEGEEAPRQSWDFWRGRLGGSELILRHPPSCSPRVRAKKAFPGFGRTLEETARGNVEETIRKLNALSGWEMGGKLGLRPHSGGAGLADGRCQACFLPSARPTRFRPTCRQVQPGQEVWGAQAHQSVGAETEVLLSVQWMAGANLPNLSLKQAPGVRPFWVDLASLSAT